MKTLHRHISGDYLVTFVMTLLVFTFVMCIGIIFKASDLLARGVAWAPVFKVIMFGVPAILSFSIPISVMTSSLLVFGRLSSDGEITAMRACGVSLWGIASRPILFAFFFSVLCLYLNSALAPRSHLARNSLKAQLGVESAQDILDEGRFIRDFPGLTIFVGRKKETYLENIRIYDVRSPVKTEIMAKTGTFSADAGGTNLVLTLLDARVDPIPGGSSEAGYCDSYEVIIPRALKKANYVKRADDLMLGELAARMKNPEYYYLGLNDEDLSYINMALAVEFNKRIALGFSCLAFMLMGVPLGIRSHRKESSIGIALGLLLFFGFYIFIMMAEELSRKPELRPDLLVLLPLIISAALSFKLIRRVN